MCAAVIVPTGQLCGHIVILVRHSWTYPIHRQRSSSRLCTSCEMLREQQLLALMQIRRLAGVAARVRIRAAICGDQCAVPHA